MKKTIAAIILAVFICCLASCGARSIYAMEQEAEREALNEKYREGISAAQEQISFHLQEEIQDLCYDIEDIYGLHPEEAVMILSNYADVPDEVTEEELHKAIWAIYRYYYDSVEIMDGIEDYWID